ncbi:MAG: hypothetical protein A2068_00850 [Ignavibacteria bacterium GWB2_35_6b]|nr:MAG: hypothetical protein A2068_00850 [Ignavibacteria bacterium GWB2_35_6b]
MNFIKKGKIYTPITNQWWKSHAMAPSPILLDENILRVFVGALNEDGISSIAYVDLDSSNPANVLNVSKKPVLTKGRPGTFDENGVFPASVYRYEDKIYLYYTGFQLGDKVRYFMFGGLAISEDNGNTFKRVSEVPVTDRSDEGLCFRGGPSVLYEDGKFKVYYSSGSQWVEVDGKDRPTYDIFFIESEDGINIGKRGIKCLEYNRNFEHGLGRPQILKDNGIYMLFYTRRTKDMKYLSGYAESIDGINWIRKDDKLNLTHSPDGWDSDMIYFPNAIKYGDKYYLFYNGNNFGEMGFGYAGLELN